MRGWRRRLFAAMAIASFLSCIGVCVLDYQRATRQAQMGYARPGRWMWSVSSDEQAIKVLAAGPWPGRDDGQYGLSVYYGVQNTSRPRLIVLVTPPVHYKAFFGIGRSSGFGYTLLKSDGT